jgi:hypothetical protein
MTSPDSIDEEPFDPRPVPRLGLSRSEPEADVERIHWGVPPDPAPTRRSPIGHMVWIVISILIILSLVLPWILPYLVQRRVPLRDGLQANLTTEHTEITEIIKFLTL